MNRLKIILKENHTLHDMMIGILAVNIALAIIALFVSNREKALYAVLIGTVTAIIYVIHMAVSIDDAMCLDEEGAVSQTRIRMLVRYAFVGVVAGVSLYFNIADPIFLTISIITIKAGSYLQPVVHKLFNRRWDK